MKIEFSGTMESGDSGEDGVINLAWRLIGPISDGGIPAPVADFSANITALQEPTSMTVNFTDLSTGATSWLWNFGDSTTSTDQNPTKVYTAPGVYTVSLTATNAGGDNTETKVGYITVTAWYRAGGAPAPAGAYRAKGAASYAASKVNLANPGTNDLAEGNGAITWDATNGWQLVLANAKYFATGLTPAAGWTLLIQFSDVAGLGYIAGSKQSGASAASLFISPTRVNPGVRYGYGDATMDRTPSLLAGNLGLAASQPYRNGNADGAAGGTWSGTPSPILIGCYGDGATPQLFVTANIKAVVIYNTTLTAPQMAAVATAMAGL